MDDGKRSGTTSNRTYPLSSVTHAFRKGKPSHDDNSLLK